MPKAYVVERAPNARASCKGVCGMKFEKDVLRFGVAHVCGKSGKRASPAWTHLSCAPAATFDAAIATCGDLCSIPGVKELEIEDTMRRARENARKREERLAARRSPPA